MPLNLKISAHSKLSTALLKVIRLSKKAEDLALISRIEDLAGLIYHALPNREKYQSYSERVNCNITWYPDVRKLTVSFLLMVDSMIFEPTKDGVRLVELESDWEIKGLIKLLEDAIAHYLTEDGTSFKESIPNYGLIEMVAESEKN
jgi:hypothetical protein